MNAVVEVELALEAAWGASRHWRLALKAYYADGAVNSQAITSSEALTYNPLLTVPALSTRDGRSPIATFPAFHFIPMTKPAS